MRKINTIITEFWILVWAVMLPPISFASGPVLIGGTAPCSECHFEILEEIGQGEHIGELLEAGTDYSDCGQCHDPHPEVAGSPVNVHHFSRFGNDELCSTCHFSGNLSGASTMVLPPKSALCAPCHISDFTMDDPVSIIALVVFLLGFMIVSGGWISGSLADRIGEKQGMAVKMVNLGSAFFKNVVSFKMVHGLIALLLEGMLQRKLYRQNKVRWALHGLIAFPMLLRFGWGIFVVVFASLFPDHPISLEIMDKNHPVFGSLLFEFSGWLAVAGIILMAVRAVTTKPEETAGLPYQGKAMFYLLAGVLVVGFILKAMRIAMTGFPEGAETAILSHGIASLFTGSQFLTQAYGYVWYFHAVLWGLFVAVLPFSRMFHIIMGPVNATIKGMQRHEKLNR